MLEPWPTVDMTAWYRAGVEPNGQNEHAWWAPDSSSRPWLFKITRVRPDRVLAEHLIEKLASEIAQRLGVPAAPVELAVDGRVSGAIVEAVRPSGWELYAGQVLMPEAVGQDYDPSDKFAAGHRPETILRALGDFAPPTSPHLPSDFTAFDTFVGYLVFDALVAHTDRHDRNWAVLRPPPGDLQPDRLCASFDHGSSLGHTLTRAACTVLVNDADALRTGLTTAWRSASSTGPDGRVGPWSSWPVTRPACARHPCAATGEIA